MPAETFMLLSETSGEGVRVTLERVAVDADERHRWDVEHATEYGVLEAYVLKLNKRRQLRSETLLLSTDAEGHA